jgi:hypothetical protein
LAWFYWSWPGDPDVVWRSIIEHSENNKNCVLRRLSLDLVVAVIAASAEHNPSMRHAGLVFVSAVPDCHDEIVCYVGAWIFHSHDSFDLSF